MAAPSDSSAYDIQFTSKCDGPSVDPRVLQSAVRSVLHGEGITKARISLAIVDDPTIHELNVRFLNHDYPTDVLSFPLSDDGSDVLEGEIVVSVETANRCAERFSWSPQKELCLYCIHGALHLVGYTDSDEKQRHTMREQERHYMQLLGMPFEPSQENNFS